MPPVFELMPDSSVNLGNGRDRLTQLPLDEQGRYSRQMVVGGKAYEPKYWPCATAECVSGAQNLDMTDPGTQAFVKALDAQVFKDISTGVNYGLIATPVGVPGRVLAATGVMASAGSAMTDSSAVDEALKYGSQYGATRFFTDVLQHTPAAAARAVAIIDLTGGWDAFVARIKKDFGE
jgi:filamentous hemagglutinin